MTLQGILAALGGTMTVQIDGTILLSLGGQNFILIPDLTLGIAVTGDPSAQWWQDAANHFFYRDTTLLFLGTLQGFTLQTAP